MLSAFLIDLDGTILDSGRSFIMAYNKTLTHFKLPLLPQNELSAIQILRKPVEEIFPKLLGVRSTDQEFLEVFIDDLKESYSSIFLANTKLCPSAREVIAELKRLDHKIGIVSSRHSFADYITPALRNLGIDGMIDLTITSRDVAITKPSPEPFLLAAKKLKKDAIECAVVGDSPEDIIAGRSAGMLTVAYTGGFYTKEELVKFAADLLIDDLIEIMPLLNQVYPKKLPY